MRQIAFSKFMMAGLAVIESVGLPGCGAKQSVVGKWSGALPGAGGTVPAVLDFRADGTLVQTAGTGAHTIVANAKYTTTSDTLNATAVSAIVDGKPTDLPAPAKATQVYKFKVDGRTLTLMTGSMQIALQKTN